MAICLRRGKASEGENLTIRRSESDEELSSTFDVILGLVPRICHGILILSIADARGRPEHDEGEVFPHCQPILTRQFCRVFYCRNPPSILFCLRAATLFSGKTLRAPRSGRNSDACYRISKKIKFFNSLARRNSSFQSKNSFLDLCFSRLHCVHEISPANDGRHGQGYAFFDRTRF